MAGRCDQCGVEEYMPYVCKFCKGRYCAAHRLPENHACAGLDTYRERVRAEGRVMAPEPGVPMSPSVSTTARAGASMDAFWARMNGKVAYVFIGICIAMYVLEVLVLATNQELFGDVFVIQPDFLVQPWTIVTSIFSHAPPPNLNHLLFNMLVLFFFGPTVERLIGSKRLALLFLVAGAVAGIAEVLVELLVFGRPVSALGASGAIQGIMGTLVVLAPTLTVLVFFVIPAPLWALVIFYVFMDVIGVISPGNTVANIAHLAGLGIGVAYGYHLRQKGLRAVVRRPPPSEPSIWNR